MWGALMRDVEVKVVGRAGKEPCPYILLFFFALFGFGAECSAPKTLLIQPVCVGDDMQ